MKRNLFCVVLILFVLSSTAVAQVGIGTTTPNASAALDITSTTRGLLIPRLTTAQRNAIISPANSLLIYQTDGTPGYYYRNGAVWTLLNFNYVLQQNLNTNGKYISGDGLNNGLLLRANGIVLGKGTYASGVDFAEAGAGTKLIWYPKKAAFRAGGISGSQWDNLNIGAYSAAFGYSNTAKGANSFSAGYQNNANSLNAVALGYQNTVAGTTSAAIGYRNKATGLHSIALGDSAIASGSYSIAIGYKAIASGEHSVVLGFAEVTGDGGDPSPIVASGQGATAMGGGTTASGAWSTALGLGTVAGGSMALANGWGSTAGGYYSTSLGMFTSADGDAAVALGAGSSASGYQSVAIGSSSEASGENSTALGSSVSTNLKAGSFIIGDISGYGTGNDADNQMMMRFAGGYKLFTNSAATVGVRVVPGGNAWSTLSDRNKKENLAPVNGDEILKKIADFKLTSWNYKGQDAKTFRHYGPMAQDFFAAFGHDQYGTIGNDTTINQADFEGINLIAIQALEKRTTELNAKNQALQSENEKLRDKNAQLQKDNEQLKERVEAQEQHLAQLQTSFTEQQQFLVKRLAQLEALVATKAESKQAVAAK